jgi:hypothetical protein
MNPGDRVTVTDWSPSTDAREFTVLEVTDDQWVRCIDDKQRKRLFPIGHVQQLEEVGVSAMHRVEPALTDSCRECGTTIQYASIDRKPFAWVHVLTRDGSHQPVPESLTLRSIVRAYEEQVS